MENYWTRGHACNTHAECEEAEKKPCKRCGKPPNKGGEDACLGHLPGVRFACCGHGEQEGYIMFTNGVTIRGNFKVEYEHGLRR